MPIRATVEADWERLREVRLAALADAPTAFSTTLGEARRRPDEWWREWARGERSQVFVVDDGSDRFAGVVAVFVEGADARLISMWVRPSSRRRGLARALVGRVVEWSRARGARRVVLGVTDVNAGARALYAGCGFVPTGRTDPLPHSPAITEIEMIRDL